jgi:pyruvate dehydrogenase E2 component (dihydrolipoamide acetyltransferase)
VEVPGVNGYWVDGGFKPGEGVHVGCAIALRDGGLVAPAIHDADRKDLDTLMSELTDLVSRARRGTLRSSELADPTITLTNLGDLGVEAAFAVIYPPQVAIVGFGKAT